MQTIICNGKMKYPVMQEQNPYLIKIPEVPYQPPSKSPSFPKNNISKTIFGFLGIMMLTIGAGLGVLLVQNQQIFRGKAAENTTAQKIAEIAENLGQNQPSNTSVYTSSDLGYQITFDKNYWTPTTDLNQSNLQTISLSLNNQAGNAQITFASFDLTKKLKSAKGVGNSLDLLAQTYATDTNSTSKEKVRMNGRDYYKLSYDLNFLNQRSQYFKYLTINGNNYYVITAKYSTFGNGQAFANQFIDSLSFLPQNPSVKAATTNSIPATVLDESKIVELTKPSVFEIAHIYCNNIDIPNLSGTKYLKASYTFCNGALGSGFAINKDGFIATNGHVAKSYPEEAMVQAFLYKSTSIKPFAIDLIQEIALIQTGQEISTDQATIFLAQAENDPNVFQILMNLIYKMMQQNLLVLKENQNRYFVKLSNDPLVIDTKKSGLDILNSITSSDTVKEATYVASNYPNAYTTDAILNNKPPTGSDVAILKIINPGKLVFPSVNLGTSDGLKEGSDVIVIGYPGLVSGSASADSLINQKSSATATVTRGIISAIKNDQGGLKLIQVDASIDHGNSGGPAFDTNGNVIGIATYGMGSTSGNYNFLRDINDLKKLASDNSVSIGTSATYDQWAQGLSYFWIEHYRQAEIPFAQVQKDYPIHPTVIGYVSDSNTAIQKGQDKSGLLFLLTHDLKTQLIFAGIIFAVIGGGVGIIIFIHRKKTPGTGITPTQQTVQTTQSIQPTPLPLPQQPTFVGQNTTPVSPPRVFSTNGPLANNI
ncbi:MAG: Peptidase S1 and S6, chymotrypsin/Hap [Candidatus Woesebacteria bacterium GW2011_GWB1_39_10]|uniref:Peptidase S1 and S6, chymotrypsin/Hap n=2 Tax=Candidatus Woeseibacteriota TaxID=1752722 RepID=A0A0G0LVT7_9BACT|nr:MAG: Peptidase S1 and S6, chymotrypsin/Hap [Candidatus Woesebacteria bacterium GW2011_GWB1_39_10]KKS91060.1 MAG: Peptidase S1 and S6, chymotrypsin/Hap [Candidatus Woesebacteria bacterium GW2011_GWA1_43_12]